MFLLISQKIYQNLSFNNTNLSIWGVEKGKYWKKALHNRKRAKAHLKSPTHSTEVYNLTLSTSFLRLKHQTLIPLRLHLPPFTAHTHTHSPKWVVSEPKP